MARRRRGGTLARGKRRNRKTKKASPIKGIRATRINYARAASSRPYMTAAGEIKIRKKSAPGGGSENKKIKRFITKHYIIYIYIDTTRIPERLLYIYIIVRLLCDTESLLVYLYVPCGACDAFLTTL